MDSTYIVNPTCSKVVRRKKKHFASTAEYSYFRNNSIIAILFANGAQYPNNKYAQGKLQLFTHLSILLLWCAWELHPHLHSENSIGACNISVAQQNGLGCSQRINVNFRSRLLLLHIVERILSSPFCTRCHRNSIHRY